MFNVEFKEWNYTTIKINKLNNVRLNPFKKEREIQDLVEENTDTLFDVDFVSSEFIKSVNLELIHYVLIWLP